MLRSGLVQPRFNYIFHINYHSLAIRKYKVIEEKDEKVKYIPNIIVCQLLLL